MLQLIWEVPSMTCILTRSPEENLLYFLHHAPPLCLYTALTDWLHRWHHHFLLYATIWGLIGLGLRINLGLIYFSCIWAPVLLYLLFEGCSMHYNITAVLLNRCVPRWYVDLAKLSCQFFLLNSPVDIRLSWRLVVFSFLQWSAFMCWTSGVLCLLKGHCSSLKKKSCHHCSSVPKCSELNL